MQWYHLHVFRGVSGFVLVGGKSTRMGTDKALLIRNGRTLAGQIAEELQAVVEPVCLVGLVARYRSLGFPVIPDAAPDRGPLSGIEAALLSAEASEWNLIVACDMPRVDADLFRTLAEQAQAAGDETDCIIPQSKEGRLQPLCALYRVRCGPIVQRALASGVRRVLDIVEMVRPLFWPIADSRDFQNVNTPPEWERFLNDR